MEPVWLCILVVVMDYWTAHVIPHSSASWGKAGGCFCFAVLTEDTCRLLGGKLKVTLHLWGDGRDKENYAQPGVAP